MHSGMRDEAYTIGPLTLCSRLSYFAQSVAKLCDDLCLTPGRLKGPLTRLNPAMTFTTFLLLRLNPIYFLFLFAGYRLRVQCNASIHSSREEIAISSIHNFE